MSRKLQQLQEQYDSNPTLTTLLEYLEECKKEQKWEEISKIISGWDGAETPEIHFYRGLSLINLNKKSEGIQELKKVVAINPNHFAAKKELEQYADEEEQTAPRPVNKIKKIVIVEPKLEEARRDNMFKLRNFAVVSLLIVGLIVALYFLFHENPAKKYELLLENPEANFVSLTYSDYVTSIKNYKIVDIRENLGENLKKSILWTFALAILDFHLDFETEEELSQFRIYSTLVSDKGKKLAKIIDFIDGERAPSGVELYYKLDREYPKSKTQIDGLKLELPEIINKNNLREAFYKALILFRKGDLVAAEKLNDKILATFDNYELSQKLAIMIRAKTAIKSGVKLENYADDSAILNNWKSLSRERYFWGEAKILLGIAALNDEILLDGFYSVCPGRTFCRKIARDFIKKDTNEASRMALYMKEKRDANRDGEDIKLVLETSYANGDFSNCYFAYRELQQFFPKSVDKESFLRGAECSEKNGYLEEAVAAYEEIDKENPNLEISAKILRMKYRLSGEELYFNQLKELADKNPKNLETLYSLLDALSKKGKIAETVDLLKNLYELETKENKPKIIEEFIKYGAVFQAIDTLKRVPDDKKARAKLNEIYNRYMLFDKADSLLEIGKTNAPVWTFLREQIKLKERGEFEIALKEIDKTAAALGYCEPALIYLKAELYRDLGDKQRTFAMIDAMLECDPFYLPGLIFAAEITYYQGDLTKAKNGLRYILENERFLSPGSLIFHNYLVLLNAEIMITEGREKLIVPFLKKNLLKEYFLGKREVERISDITEKLKESKKLSLIDFLKKNYKFSVPLINSQH